MFIFIDNLLTSFQCCKAKVVFALLSMMLSSAVIAQTNDDLSRPYKCSMQLIHRSIDANQNKLIQYYFANNKWSERFIVHDSPGTYSKRPSLAHISDDQFIAVWVERNSRGSQLMYKLTALGQQWQSTPKLMTSEGGFKTAPIVFSSLSGQVYLAWVSDQNGNDDIFLSTWNGNAWSTAESLTHENKNPDISPVFSYQKNKQGALDLLLGWQERDSNGIFQSENVTLELGLELDAQAVDHERFCLKDLQNIALPSDVQSGFLLRSNLTVNAYERIQPFR